MPCTPAGTPRPDTLHPADLREDCADWLPGWRRSDARRSALNLSPLCGRSGPAEHATSLRSAGWRYSHGLPAQRPRLDQAPGFVEPAQSSSCGRRPDWASPVVDVGSALLDKLGEEPATDDQTLPNRELGDRAQVKRAHPARSCPTSATRSTPRPRPAPTQRPRRAKSGTPVRIAPQFAVICARPPKPRAG